MSKMERQRQRDRDRDVGGHGRMQGDRRRCRRCSDANVIG